VVFQKVNNYQYQSVMLYGGGDFYHKDIGLSRLLRSDYLEDFHCQYRYWIDYLDPNPDIIKRRNKFILNLWRYDMLGGHIFYGILLRSWGEYHGLL